MESEQQTQQPSCQNPRGGGGCFGMLHMEISAARTKVMALFAMSTVCYGHCLLWALFAMGTPASDFTCNGPYIEPVSTFKYLGLHFHHSRDAAHVLQPIMSKAAGCWATVQRRHPLLQCGSIVNIPLQLLQSVLVPALVIAGVRCGACTAQVHVLLGRHAWLYSKCMNFTSGSFVAWAP